MSTPFKIIYDCFLGKITDDMYVELTPADTLRDLQMLLIQSLPNFEFPRFQLDNYTIKITIKEKEDVSEDDFVIGNADSIFRDNPYLADISAPENNQVYIDSSAFNLNLTSEEVNIIATLMMCTWVQRQVTSIENTRMKYSGSDFKMTSQANHLQKLMGLLTECQKQSRYLQRLYKRRRLIQNEDSPFNGLYRSNWDVLGRGVYYDRYDY